MFGKIMLSAAGLSLAGCAMSSAGLSRTNVEMSLTSGKTPKEWATCAAEAMIGPVELRDDGTNWWITRQNGYQIPVSRWDFKPTANGSVAELRATVSINTGDERVKACA